MKKKVRIAHINVMCPICDCEECLEVPEIEGDIRHYNCGFCGSDIHIRIESAIERKDTVTVSATLTTKQRNGGLSF